MRITEKLPSFPKKTLLLVTSKQDAQLYLAYNGLIHRMASVKVQKPPYTDREGFFRTKIQGIHGIRSGSVLRPVDRAVRLDFKHILNDAIVPFLRQDIEYFVLFTPIEYKNETQRLLPKKVKSRLIKTIYGNYIEKHPFDLIKKIKPLPPPLK